VSGLRIAWRNLRRNGRRTAISLAAITFSTMVLIVTLGLMEGMLSDMLHSVTNMVVGEAQVHHPEYLSERSIYDTLADTEAILAAAQEAGIAAAPRAYGYGLLSSGTKSAGVQFWGVDPMAERAVGELPESILRGSFLGDNPRKQVVLGRKLARTLAAQVGTELVVIVQAADGALGSDLFTVVGIMKSAGDAIDRSMAMIHHQGFAELFVLPGGWHEVVLNSKGKRTPEEVAALVTPAAEDAEVKTWRQLLPSVAKMVQAVDGMLFLFGAMFSLAAGLGVLNTMLMATYERIPEFGLIKALGATPWRIVREVATEALLLGLVGGLLGGAAGALLTWYFQGHPIDLSGFAEGFNTSGVAISAEWRADFSFWIVVLPMVGMWLVALLAALYPASKAARLDPVRALTHV
jgi:ABC-type lipoprotein release transport system permease subunit